MSSRAADLIAYFEGCRLTAYRDLSGAWAIGRGHTKGVSEGDVCTEDQADRWFDLDVAAAQKIVQRLVKVRLTEAMEAALTSFAFYYGEHKMAGSPLLAVLNDGNYLAVPYELQRWRHVGNGEERPVPLLALVRRRLDEAQLFVADGLPE